jgi:hypothetical protein
MFLFFIHCLGISNTFHVGCLDLVYFLTLLILLFFSGLLLSCFKFFPMHCYQLDLFFQHSSPFL